MANRKIQIENLKVGVKTSPDQNDYISLTDMARWKNPEFPADVVKNWLRTKFTIQFLGVWESAFNSDFKLVEFDQFKNEAGTNGFVLTPQNWINSTNAKGIISKSGRYGGTYAHRDIAFEFASWLSPEFKLYLIKEFQRLKELEKKTTENLEWQIKRSLTKTNYRIHTKAIQEQLKDLNLSSFQKKIRYADEADMLNLILFGKKAKEWEKENPDLVQQGLNMRDAADIDQLIVLSGLETLNAYLLNQDISKNERVKLLVVEAQRNLSILQEKGRSKLGHEKKALLDK